jgi:hypothetical protein
MVCLRNMCINTLHKGDSDDDNNNNNCWLICLENYVAVRIYVQVPCVNLAMFSLKMTVNFNQ